ncbi:Cof-type HAD-IIB family hydrolase [Paenibacillaceae bacterium WGS1546]|uniref:Cof-type HAD-IIB family hydrolase n=1 Tax=Cohnella sp. WGS1546 TaxID=3366810 RepID=UPI00372D1788
MNYRLIALDVDGTLLNDNHELTPRVRDAVRAASEQGAEIVICTGRGSTSALPVLLELGLQGTMITHNGASVVDSETRSVLDDTIIPHEHALRYVSYLRERAIHFDMNTAFDLFVEDLKEEAAEMYRDLLAKPIVRAAEEGFPERLVKLSIYASKEELDAVERDWRDWRHELQAIRSGDRFIDVQHAGASKGKALERLAALRGIPRSQVLAMGNYYNDTGMLAFAGFGVAMANSPDEVRAAANEVTASNNEDGVAVAIERLVLAAR